eukprot:CAMPEP_0180651656 /NCGR_PEP_ID=MMETSP1037_2-20121125/53017_1 /TAXON_ID=632150 /ORGANISM="Azadinium spinosum, Strain 3D9" /LENGTH=61 /DNA_ID=CAMNT_0022677351 /DNA_START=131 /DNA_END=313 /DNA_ORIENTATION=-
MVLMVMHSTSRSPRESPRATKISFAEAVALSASSKKPSLKKPLAKPSNFVGSGAFSPAFSL